MFFKWKKGNALLHTQQRYWHTRSRMYNEHAPTGRGCTKFSNDEKCQFSVEFSISRNMKSDTIVSIVLRAASFVLVRVVNFSRNYGVEIT